MNLLVLICTSLFLVIIFYVGFLVITKERFVDDFISFAIKTNHGLKTNQNYI